jgi:hypothetical protein
LSVFAPSGNSKKANYPQAPALTAGIGPVAGARYQWLG